MKLEMPETARVTIDIAGNRREITTAPEIELQAKDGKVRFTLSPVVGPAHLRADHRSAGFVAIVKGPGPPFPNPKST